MVTYIEFQQIIMFLQSFDGSGLPEIFPRWPASLDYFFYYNNHIDAYYKIQIAKTKLDGCANLWWRTVEYGELQHQRCTSTWAEMRKLLLEEFLPFYRHQKQEFYHH
ncbi:hypothetical protein ACH5RR_023428 [Cinchona calisaya]|uniref:Retrotransposon gag domain-containing protein n=1 Tax=Cinchona calisaya TaxID=153742 RepID=A0ABD2ZAM7_9GENT